jgi:hypothetical protein
MKVLAWKCLLCGDTVFSRARHDYRTCSCGQLAVDGGFDYTKLGYVSENDVERTQVEVSASEAELYEDWNTRKDNFGVIKENAAGG